MRTTTPANPPRSGAGPVRRASTWGSFVAALALGMLPAAALGQSSGASGQPVASSMPVASAPAVAGTGFDGTWTVDPSIGSFDYAAGDFSGSWVGYRVQEELAGVGGAVAVGRTPDVTGTITLLGSTLTAADLAADLTTLQSDESMRDGQLGHQGVQTDQFPSATFVLTQPIELAAVPEDDVPFEITAVGDLTIHGVTKSVSIPLSGIRSGDVVGVSGSISFTWSDFGMEQPTSMRVVSLANDVTMELQVFFRHDAATSVASPAEPSETPGASRAP